MLFFCFFDTITFRKKTSYALREVVYLETALTEISESICRQIEEMSNGKRTASLHMIDTELICPNPFHAPVSVSDDELKRLSASIRKDGFQTPLTVRAIGTSQNPLFQLISGEKYLRACIYANITPIPCVIIDNNKDTLFDADEIPFPRNFFEEADMIYELIKKSGATTEEMAKRLGISEEALHIKFILREMDPTERKIVLKSEISAECAALLFTLPPKTKCELYQVMVNGVRRRSAEDMIYRAAENCGKTKICIKNTGFFFNSIDKAVATMNKSGISVKCAREEKKTFTRLIITVPKQT